MIQPNENSGSLLDKIISLTKPLPIDLEFKGPNDIGRIFSAMGLPIGLCVGSKSGYRQRHPDHEFYPNANVFSLRLGKIWWGDLDLNVHGRALQKIARIMGERLYVLREMDGRFENMTRPATEARYVAIWHTGRPDRLPWRSYQRESGFNVDQFKRLLCIPEKIWDARIPVTDNQSYLLRLENFRNISLGLQEYGKYPTWSRWWLEPHECFSGLSPFAHLVDQREPIEITEDSNKYRDVIALCWCGSDILLNTKAEAVYHRLADIRTSLHLPD